MSTSVLFQLQLFSAIAIGSGIILLTYPSLLLRTPLEPTIVRFTGLPSSSLDPAALAVAAIPITAIGYIYWCSIWSGDDKFVRASVRGRLLFATISAYLLLFTDRGSTGLLTMFVVDLTFALWLGFTIGFGRLERGTLDLEKIKRS